MKKICVFLLLQITLQANAIDFYGIYPTNWWVGMKTNKLQLMLHGEHVGLFTKVTINHPGVTVVKLSKVENSNYLFADLIIGPQTKPGKFKIILSGGGLPDEDVNYELMARSKEDGKTRAMGITSKDFLYLMIPDRFSNGDPSNDIIADYRDQTSDRKNMFSRHGGDFKGIENHFDYFQKLGVTALWLTPIIENNTHLMKEVGYDIAGYHGYWFTDHYQIDKRLGGNDGYLEFCNAAHKKGIKVVQDAIYNHISKEHFFATDPPSKDWLNNWPTFTTTNHREEALFDPYGSAYDKKVMLDGWFTDHLPDLNQRNPFLATFLIQHAIWSTEYFGVDGWRVDTYKYCDEQFLNNVNAALEREFPGITIFGEAMVNSIIGNAYFTQNTMGAAFKHNANSVIDFQTCFAMLSGMNLSQGWTDGVNKLYMTMAQDFVYKNPMRNCIFLDNHDMDRVFSVVDEDWDRLKIGLTWLLTIRGIPQLYYGTEVLMKNKKGKTDANVREDFPGGWQGDPVNRFNAKDRTDKENEAYNYISTLAGYRKTSSALTTGKTTQFYPYKGLYTYFRYDTRQTIVVITNSADNAAKPRWETYIERTAGFTKIKNIITGKISSFEEVELQPKECLVAELIK